MKLTLLLLLCIEKVRSDNFFDNLNQEIEKLLSGEEIQTMEEIKKTFLSDKQSKDRDSMKDDSEKNQKILKELEILTALRDATEKALVSQDSSVDSFKVDQEKQEPAKKIDNVAVPDQTKPRNTSIRDLGLVEGFSTNSNAKINERLSNSQLKSLEKQLYVLMSFVSQSTLQKVETLNSFMSAIDQTFIVAKNQENNYAICENNPFIVASEPKISFPNAMPASEFSEVVADILKSEVIVVSKNGSGIEISTGLEVMSKQIQEESKSEDFGEKELEFNGAKYEKKSAVPVARCLIEQNEEGEPAFFPLSNLEFYQRIGDSDATSLIIKIVKDATLPPIGKTLYLSINSGVTSDIKVPLISLVTIYGSNAADIKVEIDEDAMLFAIPVVEDTPDLIINVFNLATVNKAEYMMQNQSNVFSLLSSDLLSSNPFVNYYTNACNFLPPSFDLPTTQEIALNLIYEKMRNNAIGIEVKNDEMNKMAISSFITEMRSKLGNKKTNSLKPDSFYEFLKSVTSCVSSIADLECKKDIGASDSQSSLNMGLSMDISVMFKDYLTHTDYCPTVVADEYESATSKVEPAKIQPKSTPKKIAKANAKKQTKSKISGSYYVAGGVVIAVCAVVIYTFVF